MAFARIHSRLSRLAAFMLMAVLSIALTACPRPLTPPMGAPGPGTLSGSEAEQVVGHVDFGGRSTQATIDDNIMPGSTIALIEVDTGNTVSTARSDANGKFILKYSNGFKPVPGKLYYFEAIKGLDAGSGNYNAVGADLVRVRTIATYRTGGWVSLTSDRYGFYMPITPMTTAVSIVVSLRSSTNRKIDASTLFGSVKLGQSDGKYPDSLVFPDTALFPVTLAQGAYNLVMDAFAKERDPMRWIQLAGGDPLFNKVELPDVPFTLLGIAPPAQVPLQLVSLVGTNYEGQVEVHFQRDGGGTVSAQGPNGGAPEISPDRTRITVRVPANAINGRLELKIRPDANSPWRTLISADDFLLATMDGHSVVDLAGRVYAANEGLGTIVRLQSTGQDDRLEVATLISDLDKPSALTFAPGTLRPETSFDPISYDYLFVGQGGTTRQIVEYDLRGATPVATPYHTGVGVANPSGIAFAPSKALYVTDATANKLYVIPSRGAAVQEVALQGKALNNPRGIAFGPNGRMYVANSGANTVLEIDLTTTPATAKDHVLGLSTPWGVAFDPKGSFYVSNNKGNSIYRVPVTSLPGAPLVYGTLEAFSAVPTPAGIDADASGYIYAADRTTNGIYRINSNAESRLVGIGISYPVATWAGPGQNAGDREIFALTDEGRLMKIKRPQNGPSSLSVFAEGLRSTRGLTRDAAGNFYTHRRAARALTKIYTDGTTSDILGSLDAYYLASPVVRGNQIFFRTANGSLSPADLHGYNLGPPIGGAPAVSYQALMRGVVAVAVDRSGRVNNGKYFILQNNEVPKNLILKVTRYSGERAESVPFLTAAALNRVTTPVDIAVDGSGQVWVADAAGKVVVFNENGAYVGEVAVPNPVRLTYNDTHIVVTNHQAGGDVRFYTAARGLAKTLSGLGWPVGVSFEGTNMYVNTHDDGWVYRVPNYAGLPTKALTAGDRVAFYQIGAQNDIEVIGGNLYFTYVAGYGNIRMWNGKTLETSWRSHYYPIMRLTQDGNKKMSYVSSASWVHHQDDGFYTGFTGSLSQLTYRGDYGESVAPVGFTPYSWISYNRMGAWTQAVETYFDGSKERTFKYAGGGDYGSVVAGDDGTIYIPTLTGGTIFKWTATGTSVLAPGPYTGAIDHVWGLAFYDNKLYQPVRERHLVREVDTLTGAASVLSVGLVAPEL